MPTPFQLSGRTESTDQRKASRKRSALCGKRPEPSLTPRCWNISSPWGLKCLRIWNATAKFADNAGNIWKVRQCMNRPTWLLCLWESAAHEVLGNNLAWLASRVRTRGAKLNLAIMRYSSLCVIKRMAPASQIHPPAQSQSMYHRHRRSLRSSWKKGVRMMPWYD